MRVRLSKPSHERGAGGDATQPADEEEQEQQQPDEYDYDEGGFPDADDQPFKRARTEVEEDNAGLVDWLDFNIVTSAPIAQMPVGLKDLARLQYSKGWSRRDIGDIIKLIRTHFSPDHIPSWWPTTASAYGKHLDAGLLDDRLRGFQCVEVDIDGQPYQLFARSGIEIVRDLLERHKEEELVFRFDEKHDAGGRRVLDELNSGDAWKGETGQQLR